MFSYISQGGRTIPLYISGSFEYSVRDKVETSTMANLHNLREDEEQHSNRENNQL